MRAARWRRAPARWVRSALWRRTAPPAAGSADDRVRVDQPDGADGRAKRRRGYRAGRRGAAEARRDEVEAHLGVAGGGRGRRGRGNLMLSQIRIQRSNSSGRAAVEGEGEGGG